MRAFLRRLRARIKYRHFERDLAHEIDTHRAMAEAELTGAGEDAREARWKAARLLGNTTLAREEARAAWVPRLLQQFAQDVRYALRGLRRDVGFTAASVLILALGIGLTTGAVGFANGLFLRGWPVPESSQVFRVEVAAAPSVGRLNDGLSLAAYRHIVASARTANYVAYGGVYVRVGSTQDERGPNGSAVPYGLYVSDNFFQVLQIPLLMGRAPLAHEQSRTPTVVISHRIWQTTFAADPQIVGRTVWLDGRPATAVGVTAPEFTGLNIDTAVYVPLSAAVALNGRGSVRNAVANENACCVSVAGRAVAGVARAENATELTLLTGQYRSSIGAQPLSLRLPDTSSGADVLRRADVAGVLALVGLAAMALLAITCANVGNLHLARSLGRTHEIVTRLALGASRPRLIRQLLTEGLVLASLAGVLAFGAASSVPALIALTGVRVPASLFGVDWLVALATAVTVIVVSLMVSLAPALRATRIAWRGGVATAPARTSGLRSTLLAVQIAIATVLLLSAALIGRGIQHAVSAPSDFALTSTTAATIEWPRDSAPTNSQLKSFRSNLPLALNASGLSIGMVSEAPMSRASGLSTSVSTPGAKLEFATTLFPMNSTAATVLRLPMRAGRWASDVESRHECVINETLERQMFGDESAIGRPVRLDFDKAVYTVVGVVADTHLLSPGRVPGTMHIAPLDGTPVLLSTTSAEADTAVRTIIRSLAPTAVVRSAPLTASIRDTLTQAMAGAAVAGGFGLAALVLAMIGVYGVFSYLIEERRREIGIRLALGATRSQIRRTIFHATRWSIASGLLVGLGLSIVAGIALRRFLFGLSPADPGSYIVVAFALITSALAATAVPLRRALRVDPAITLKTE